MLRHNGTRAARGCLLSNGDIRGIVSFELKIFGLIQMTDFQEKITVMILSWNRPLYLWTCLDSLYRYTRRPARFIIVDNNSDDAMVRPIIEGFERRGMFHEVEWADTNSPTRIIEMFHKHRSISGEYFAYIESDVAVFDTDPCWLTRMCRLT